MGFKTTLGDANVCLIMRVLIGLANRCTNMDWNDFSLSIESISMALLSILSKCIVGAGEATIGLTDKSLGFHMLYLICDVGG